MSNNIILAIPNNSNDGNSHIGIYDGANKTWVKFFNNAIARFDGKIVAKEIEVKTNVWADYVFKKDYKLLPLESVEDYIKTNGHLPNIPSEIEIKNNGINVAEINVKLLEKIEELTLYSIEQNKKISDQSKEIENLKIQFQKFINKN